MCRVCVVVLIVVVALGGLFLAVRNSENVALSRGGGADSPTGVAHEVTSGGEFRRYGSGFSGCGWSTEPRTPIATEQALFHALGEDEAEPGITMVYYNPQHDPSEIVSTLREQLPTSRIFGETTHEGVLTSGGYHASPTGVVGLLALELPGIRVGVGGVAFEGTTPGEAARVALRQARKDAAAAASEKPSMVVICVTLPHEEEVVSALADEAGADVPLVGGTAAGSVDQLSRKKVSNWSIVVNDQVIRSGVGVAAFFASQPFAWSYGGGFRRTTTSGQVTKADGRLIYEIDGRPAADVYDEWLGGKVYEARDRGEDVAKFCSLYPLATNIEAGNRFVRAWPSGDPSAPGSLRTGATIRQGEYVFLSEGTWSTLLNHFASVPGKARDSIDGFEPMAGLFIYCGGALECIPNTARPQMGHLVSQSLGEVPWLGVFTWGEQGTLPGAGMLHSNLSSGTVLFPKEAN